MRIGISCYPTYGGSGAMATELGLKLADHGHEVHIVSYAQPFRLSAFHERVFFHEVDVAEYPLFEYPPYSLALAVALEDIAERYELDLIHAHYAIPHAASAWIAQEMMGKAGPRIVTTLHGTDITLVGMQPSYKTITRFSILKSDGLTAVSEFLRRETVTHFQVPEERIRVIPNFVDPAIFHPDHKPCHRASLAPGGEPILMHVSNFRPVKRVVDVVEIFARVREKRPLRLVLVGDGPDRVRAEQRARELGVDDGVMFLGKHATVEELLSCADVFLLPSETESFGLAALEAMASGAPVVATRVGGIPELVPDGEAGFLLELGDVEGMADAVKTLLDDSETAQRMRAAARAVAVERFSAARVVPEYEAFYADVLGTKGAER
ncbi:MAG: N-acetyl-alpha-D-glucosaminyl L-malate synthase BshA [Gemmatimonadota bacterium]